MNPIFKQFVDARLTKEQMIAITGGTIYCGYTVYYSGMSITGFGKCGCSTVSDCDAIYSGQIQQSHPDNIGIVSHGCWKGAEL